MIGGFEWLVRVALIGAGATVVMDLWALFLKHSFGISSLDYAMVGRWIGHLPQGRFAHSSIAKAAPVRGEAAIGQLVHYVTGIVFVALLLAIIGPEWALAPTLVPAVLFGALSVAAPFFILQPGMGAGIAGWKTPRPFTTRCRSLMAHTIFGVGMYVAAWLLARLFTW
ncbi:DUF2938 domain-containing protein [Dyella sp. Tek66A03]|uniref:DUF2938 domain-containing protein n=1 Tax=Dyella sp. Tek66A03 TaxID=3458298 RepID=UPI00403EDF95